MHLILVFFAIFLIRYSVYLSTYFYDSLNFFGITTTTHIYTPVATIQHFSTHCFDIVLMSQHHNHVHAYSLLYGDYFTIQLHHVPVGHKLVYLHNNQTKDLPYMSGTPFHVTDGQLVLCQRKRKRFGFGLDVIATSQTWPISS
jgi:hypothetical protein